MSEVPKLTLADQPLRCADTSDASLLPLVPEANSSIELTPRSPVTAADRLPAEDLPLQVYDVVKQWRKAPARVLDGLDLEVGPGEVVWIGGRNGAGKTTLLRIIAGLIDPDSGVISAYGLHPRRNRRQFQRRVGFLSAGNRGIYVRLTVQG